MNERLWLFTKRHSAALCVCAFFSFKQTNKQCLDSRIQKLSRFWGILKATCSADILSGTYVCLVYLKDKLFILILVLLCFCLLGQGF